MLCGLLPLLARQRDSVRGKPGLLLIAFSDRITLAVDNSNSIQARVQRLIIHTSEFSHDFPLVNKLCGLCK